MVVVVGDGPASAVFDRLDRLGGASSSVVVALGSSFGVGIEISSSAFEVGASSSAVVGVSSAVSVLWREKRHREMISIRNINHPTHLCLSSWLFSTAGAVVAGGGESGSALI